MGTWYRERDEDLTLFHDLRAQERSNFLYPSNDDIEASLSTRLGELSGRRVEGHASTRRAKGDLLVLDAEKSDYNWLLTPPGTPLFPSLDQDVPIIRLSQRESLTRSTLTSKTSRLSYPQEPSFKLHQGSVSPHQPRTAASISSTSSTSRGRSSSPSITSSSPILRPSSPLRRPTTPVRRTSVTSRSGTPDLQRLNSTPVVRSPSGSVNGRTRGKSLSPRSRPWEASMPGFSSEPPPNLRTSLSDCSTQRGGSQNSRHGATSASRSENGRPRRHNATSPDPLRSCSLSSNQDYTSSQTSKGSVISSCDDDTEMAESVASASTKTSCEAALRNEIPCTSRSILPAKRQTRPTVSEDRRSILNLTAKRSSERQVDRHRSSQSMFRPLLSSVPASSFYNSKAASAHHASTISVLESSVTMTSKRAIEFGEKVLPEETMTHGDERKKESTSGGQCLDNSGSLVGKDGNDTGAHARNNFSSVQKPNNSEGETGVSRTDLKDHVHSSNRIEEAVDTMNGQVFVDKLERHTHASGELSLLTDLGDPARILEARVLEADDGQRTPNKNPLIERSFTSMGRDLSMERKEVLHGDAFSDVRDVMELNSSLHSSAASVCDFQASAGYSRPSSTEDNLAKHASEQSPELLLDALLEKTLSCYSDSFGKKDILFDDTELAAVEQFVPELDNENLCTTQETVDVGMLHADCKLPGREDVEAGKHFENTHDEAVVGNTKCPDGAPKKQQPEAMLLKRNVTLEEATDTILFCNSIVHGIVYKAATIAVQSEESACAKNFDPKRDYMTFFGRLEGEPRKTAGNWKQQPAGSAIRRTFRYVQKRRMVHQQTPTVILQQSPMDRTENAIVGNQEEDLSQTIFEDQKKTTPIKTVDSRCNCSIM